MEFLKCPQKQGVCLFLHILPPHPDYLDQGCDGWSSSSHLETGKPRADDGGAERRDSKYLITRAVTIAVLDHLSLTLFYMS